jgi:hypothetical protein
LDSSESQSKIPGKFWNALLEKNGEISWIGCVRNEEVLIGVKEGRNFLHTIKRRKDG